MEKQKRRSKSGIKILKDQKLYNRRTEKYVLLTNDIVINDWQDHVGHIRFNYNHEPYSFITSYNKNGFEFLYS